jgi:ATP-dependent Clp protease ATP-binding subunit ClpA
MGAPPGYVGYEEGGQLTEAVRRRPYSVVLFDEIEKAHPDVFNSLLQILDDGRLTDGQGRTVDFKNTVIIMTSNLGAEIYQKTETPLLEIMEKGLKDEIMTALRAFFRPEFLNRIDEVVVFHNLPKESIKQIVDIQIAQVNARLSAKKIVIEIDDKSKEYLAAAGFDPHFGARPLKRAVQREIVDVLSGKLLSGGIKEGARISVTASPKGGGLKFDVS